MVVLTTGGKSLPKTDSSGSGYALVHSLGHTLPPTCSLHWCRLPCHRDIS